MMKSGSQVTRAAAACALILNAAISHGAVPEVETQRLNDSSRKESSLSGAATTNVPEVPRNVLQLKDADDLMAKYVRLADLTIDDFTPEAIEAIFGIKLGPRADTGSGGFAARFDQSSPNEYPLELFYSRRSLFGMVDMEARWPDYRRPPICIDFKKLKAELEQHGWVIAGPPPNLHGVLSVSDSFIRADGDQNHHLFVEWVGGKDCVVRFTVRHEFAVGEQK